MYPLIKKFLFNQDPEDAHYIAMAGLKMLHSFGLVKSFVGATPDYKRTTICGLDFKNPIGLAAGFDKNALWIDELSLLGFSHIEIGTVTPLPQSGNPKPRLFRVIEEEALINRMGFNNDGSYMIAQRLDKQRKLNADVIIGGNIGKNKQTPNDEADQDYVKSFNTLRDFVNYFTINVSSPNTPGLRELQDKDSLIKIAQSIHNQNSVGTKRPIFLKIAPDLTEGQLEDIVSFLNDNPIDGLIATNTTLDRNLKSISQQLIEKIGAGGLSGAPLREKSVDVLKYFRDALPKNFPIISSGGIMNKDDVKTRLELGADLIQLYTGFVYGGPSIVNSILSGL